MSAHQSYDPNSLREVAREGQIPVLNIRPDATEPLLSGTQYKTTGQYSFGSDSTGQVAPDYGRNVDSAAYQELRPANDMSYNANRAADSVHRNAQYASDSVSQTANQAANSASQTANQAANSASQTANRAANSASDTVNRASDSINQNANKAADTASYHAQNIANSASNATENVKQSANNTVESAKVTANNASATAKDTANRVADSANRTAANAKDTANRVADSANRTAANARESANQAAVGLRQRVNSLSDATSQQVNALSQNPTVQNAKVNAQKQVGQFREMLGRSPLIRDLEKRTNIDRVYLVVGGVLAYLLLIPLNLFGLAYPVTTLLTLLPAAYLSVDVIDNPKASAHDERARSLLAYFVVLGFVQFLESLAGGVLARRIPQYFTLKLVFLAYLLHPRTNGAMQVHEQVFRPVLARAKAGSKYNSSVNTPPQSQVSGSAVSSPSTNPFVGNEQSTVTGTRSGSALNGDQSTATVAPSSTGGIDVTVHLPSGGGSGVGLDVPRY